jgi:hypothetical protein
MIHCYQDIGAQGLRPAIRTICDTEIDANGGWWRRRELYSEGGGFFTSCGAYFCWTTPIRPKETVDTYYVTLDTIPFGDPGHIDN